MPCGVVPAQRSRLGPRWPSTRSLPGALIDRRDRSRQPDFGRAAAEGQIVWQIRELAGREGAEVIRQMIEGARKPASGILLLSSAC